MLPAGIDTPPTLLGDQLDQVSGRRHEGKAVEENATRREHIGMPVRDGARVPGEVAVGEPGRVGSTRRARGLAVVAHRLDRSRARPVDSGRLEVAPRRQRQLPEVGHRGRLDSGQAIGVECAALRTADGLTHRLGQCGARIARATHSALALRDHAWIVHQMSLVSQVDRRPTRTIRPTVAGMRSWLAGLAWLVLALHGPTAADANDWDETRERLIEPLNSALHSHWPTELEAGNVDVLLRFYAIDEGTGLTWDDPRPVATSSTESTVRWSEATGRESIRTRYTTLLEQFSEIERADLRIDRVDWRNPTPLGHRATVHAVVRGTSPRGPPPTARTVGDAARALLRSVLGDHGGGGHGAHDDHVGEAALPVAGRRRWASRTCTTTPSRRRSGCSARRRRTPSGRPPAWRSATSTATAAKTW